MGEGSLIGGGGEFNRWGKKVEKVRLSCIGGLHMQHFDFVCTYLKSTLA